MGAYRLAMIALTYWAMRETHPLAARVPPHLGSVMRNCLVLLRSFTFMIPGLVLALSFGGFYGFAALLPFVLIDEIGLSTFGFAMVMPDPGRRVYQRQYASGICGLAILGVALLRRIAIRPKAVAPPPI
ncbi:MAG: hypothetical protein MO846_00370 [Candidatus Devosia symbiotica]|nr:hypothetical protein [Candidatus Devosia symbiotica]